MKTPTESHEETRRKCAELLGQLAQGEIGQLTKYAAKRWAYLQLGSTASPEDKVQDALTSILVGLAKGRSGRHVRPEHVTDMDAFLAFVRSAINSQSDGKLRKGHVEHDSVERLMEEDGVDWGTVDSGFEEQEFCDYAEQFFARLKKRVPRHLRSIISKWEVPCTWVPVIPVGHRHRRVRAEVQALACKVMQEQMKELPEIQ